jgi:hypothetical protein
VSRIVSGFRFIVALGPAWVNRATSNDVLVSNPEPTGPGTLLIGVVMRQLRGRSVGLAVGLALGAVLMAGCGSHKSANNSPGPASSNAPAAQTSTAPSTASSGSSGGGYGY